MKALLAQTTTQLPREDCRCCECFQALLTQLELDAAADRDPSIPTDLAAVIAHWKVDRQKMHACLGCAPCPPGEAFAEYLHRFRKHR